MASSEEAAMRDRVIEWGRQRWPGARVMHELVVEGCRIDLAFVTKDHIAGVEIKSSKDVLDRLEQQAKQYLKALPEVWLAFAPKWTDDHHAPYDVGLIMVTETEVTEAVPCNSALHSTSARTYKRPAHSDLALTVPTLGILWKSELLTLAREHGLVVKDRFTNKVLVSVLARALTGDEIIRGVCAALRGRNTGWAADAPVKPLVQLGAASVGAQGDG